MNCIPKIIWVSAMGLKETFEKQGGMRLIRQYQKGGALGTAITEFLLLGKSRTALEILRLAAEFKTKQKLEKQYRSDLEEFDRNYIEQKHQKSNKVWVCWLQGIDSAPDIVKICVNSLKQNLPSKEVVVLTDDNIGDYVQFPNFIEEKYKTGRITKTHMTDLLRLELLTRYGGTWIDATVLCTQNENTIPNYFFDSDLFFFQCLKPGRDGHSTYISSWYINAKSANKVLEAVKYLCYEYWKKNDEMVDYFLIHDFFSIVLERYPNEWKKIIPRDNATPHELLLRLFDSYDERTWNAIVQQTPFHKLSYKFTDEQIAVEGTYYRKIIQ